MKESLTASEWNAMFPSLPESSAASAKDLTTDLYNRAKIFNVVYLFRRWDNPANVEQIDETEIEDSEQNNEEILFQAGRWCVRESGIECSNFYDIGISTLNQIDWIRHLSSKSWLYDPTDMMDAFEEGLKIAFPDDLPKENRSRINKLIEEALEVCPFMFNTSRNLHRHCYLPSRMDNSEREKFFDFLSKERFTPSF